MVVHHWQGYVKAGGAEVPRDGESPSVKVGSCLNVEEDRALALVYLQDFQPQSRLLARLPVTAGENGDFRHHTSGGILAGERGNGAPTFRRTSMGRFGL